MSSHKQMIARWRRLLGFEQAPLEVLRLGRHEAQRWAVSSVNSKSEGESDLTLLSHADFREDLWQALPDTLAGDGLWPCGELSRVLALLYPTSPEAGIEVILESTWAPIMLMNTGGLLLREDEVVSLARHQFSSLYETPGTHAAHWDIRVSFIPGETWAMGFGLPGPIVATLRKASGELGLHMSRLQPAWAWGWKRAQAAACLPTAPGEDSWWAWQEQDRTLVSRVEGRGRVGAQIFSLHPGMPWCDCPEKLSDLLRAEAQRLELVREPRGLCMGIWDSHGCRFFNPPGQAKE